MAASTGEFDVSDFEQSYFEALRAAEALAETCVAVALSPNAAAGHDLEAILNYLMTELWDRGFSATEIGAAFKQAALDLPRYSAGEETNGCGLP